MLLFRPVAVRLGLRECLNLTLEPLHWVLGPYSTHLLGILKTLRMLGEQYRWLLVTPEKRVSSQEVRQPTVVGMSISAVAQARE